MASSRLTRPVDPNVSGLLFHDAGKTSSASKLTPLPVIDVEVLARLDAIEEQARITNMHLALLTDTLITKDDLPTEI